MKKLYIGIDAHKNTNSIALAFDDMQEPDFYGKVSADIDCTLRAIRKIFKKYDMQKEEVKICYETGPTGFVLARRLLKLGYDCEVIAASLIPKKSGERKKTDKRDARKLASRPTSRWRTDCSAYPGCRR